MMQDNVHVGRYARRAQTGTGIRVLRRRAEKPYKNTWDDIWFAGSKVSGGFGFWGHGVLHGTGAHKAARAWTEGLRELGWKDEDIVLFGDWTDGRHIADNMEPDKQTISQMKAHVKKNASFRSKDEVHRENLSHYGQNKETARTVATYLGMDSYGVYRAR